MATSAEQAQEEKAKGNAAFQKGDFDSAVKHFTKAIELSPSDHVLYSNRSGAYASLKDYEKALKDAETCVKLKPDWPKGYSRKGLAEFNLGRLREAAASYEKGLALDPSNASLQAGLAEVQQSESSMRELHALMAVSNAVRSHPKLQQYSKEDPDYVQKLAALVAQIQANPSNLRLVMAQPDVRIREGITVALGGTLEEEEETKAGSKAKENVPEAAKETNTPKKELTEEQKKAEEFKSQGNALYRQRKFTEALEAYDQAIKHDPNELLYLNNKAAVYMEMGEYDKCLEECNKALEKRYEVKADYDVVAKVYNRMAACYSRQKNYSKAIEMYEKSLCESNTRQTRAALADVKRMKEKADREAYIDPEKAEEHRQKGNDFFKNNDFPNAKKEYDEAILRNPKDPKLYSNRAAALTKLFEYPSALKDCETALSLDPKFVKAWSRKGNLHFQLKEFPKALEAFERGLAVDPSSRECIDGRMQVLRKVQQQQQTGEVDEEQMRHAMADPEIQQILRDPQMSIVLQNAQENPAMLKEYLQDPKIRDGINKLITAGILRVA
ncbi:Hsc70/Hsp90-organizing protein, putative [Eimeria brunetti]|uniref:Hsp70-Hsp90 organising protein n=1 Tax=Eimeria brunetti TaxID=51314 RepID=U6LLK8_9EIME|nr:Hsc70/Hsp90-organizing protein, putative [Eimeria brunetti]